MIGIDAAMRILGDLVAVTNGWDDPSVAAWAQRIAELDDAQSAVEATDTVIATHDQPGRPAWATWWGAYETIRRRRLATRQLPVTTGTPIGPGEFARRLAERGDPQSERMLTVLRRVWPRAGA